MTKKEIYVITNRYASNEYKEYLKEVFTEEEVQFIDFNDLEQGRASMPPRIDIILFAGGADVNPDLYAEKIGKRTIINKERDATEKDMFERLRGFKALYLGICRGSQFLTVMSGGRLIQHVEGHGRPHEIEIPMMGRVIEATSTHHQMMYPYELDKSQYKLVAWSRYFQSNTYLDGRNEEIEIDKEFLEPEIVFYKNTGALAIQGHPEMQGAGNSFKETCGSLIKHFIKKENREKKQYR